MQQYAPRRHAGSLAAFSHGLLAMALQVPAACAIVDTAAEAADGCAGYASGTCQALARCGEAFLAPYGTLAACQNALAHSCTETLAQPDVVGSGAGARACGDLMQKLDCNALVNRELPLGCLPPAGKRADGAPCSVGAQCASTRCAKQTPSSPWGECQEPVGFNQACRAQDDCSLGLVCTAQQRCIALSAPGQRCSDALPCRSPLQCVSGVCVESAANGCGTVQPCASQPMPDPLASCQAFAQALCNGLSKCWTPLVQNVYGDQNGCVGRNTDACLEGLRTPDAVSSVAGVVGCTNALASVDCHALLENALPDACKLASGKRDNGRACSSDTQCASTRCARSNKAMCGVCSTLAQGGEPCTQSSDCLAGLVCSEAGTCRSPAQSGTACGAAQPCAYPLRCVAGACVSTLARGAACDRANDRCDSYAGLLCDATASTTASCQPWIAVRAGEACGVTARGWAVCTGGASCTQATDAGVCNAPAAVGGSCQADAGTPCVAPARCVNGSCVVVDPAVCP